VHISRILGIAVEIVNVQSQCARGDAFGGISLHQSLLRPIGIEPRLRGVTVGDAERCSQENPHEALPCAWDLWHFHDRQHPCHLFCQKGQPTFASIISTNTLLRTKHLSLTRAPTPSSFVLQMGTSSVGGPASAPPERRSQVTGDRKSPEVPRKGAPVVDTCLRLIDGHRNNCKYQNTPRDSRVFRGGR
jgi:hypothetical protein